MLCETVHVCRRMGRFRGSARELMHMAAWPQRDVAGRGRWAENSEWLGGHPGLLEATRRSVVRLLFPTRSHASWARLIPAGTYE